MVESCCMSKREADSLAAHLEKNGYVARIKRFPYMGIVMFAVAHDARANGIVDKWQRRFH